jgi:hypothetical protein
MGLAYFGKQSKAVLCSVNIGAVSDTQKFIEKMASPNTNSEFDKL